MGDTPMKRNLNDVSEVEFNFVGFRGIGESIERLLRCGLDIFNNADNLVNRLFVDQTARSIYKQTNVFVKLNLRGSFITVSFLYRLRLVEIARPLTI